MSSTFPGTTVEVSKLQKGSSKVLFGGVFATGGITLSQVSIMTGLEPYLIQNWVKRGFVSSPVKRLYSEEQFARIVIINMLKEALQIERICSLIRVIGGVLEDTTDDLIGDAELYHRYVDMISDESINITDPESVRSAAAAAASDFVERIPNTRKKLERIFEVMLYAHAASKLRASAEQMLSTLR
jgi:DNA-binding transcriptional MerR regulator